MLSIKNVYKKYQGADRFAVEDLSLEVKRG